MGKKLRSTEGHTFFSDVERFLSIYLVSIPFQTWELLAVDRVLFLSVVFKTKIT